MAYLIVERAGVIVERRKLDRDRLTVGRGSDSDVVLDDPQIGSKLAVIVRDAGSFVLEDEGSMTGVSYQNDRVTRLVLKDGMRLEAFPFTFIFQDEEGGGGGGGSDDRVEATMAMDMSMPGESAELVCVNENFGPFPLKVGVNVVGRKAGLDIFIDHKMVSKEHALVICIPGEFVIEDKGSANGTFVNRRKITRSPIKDGDLVQFGGVEFKLVVSSADGDDSAPASQTADIEVGGLLLGGALEQQAQALGPDSGSPKKAKKAKRGSVASTPGVVAGAAMPASKKGGSKKAVMLGGVGCLALGLVAVVVMFAMTSGPPPPPPAPPEAKLKLEQAKSILQADEDYQAGVDLLDQVLASNPPADIAEEAKKVKDQLLAALRRPTPIGKMTPGQLRDTGNDKVAKGQILESVRYWERLVTIDPTWEDCGKTYSTLMYQIGLIYDGAGNREMAVQVWKRCIAVMGETVTDNPAHAKVRNRLREMGVNP